MNKPKTSPPISAEPVVILAARELSARKSVERVARDPAAGPGTLLQILTRKLLVSRGDPVRPVVDLFLARIHMGSGDKATAAVLAREAASSANRLSGENRIDVLLGAASILETVDPEVCQFVLRQSLEHVAGGPSPAALGAWLYAAAMSRNEEGFEVALAAIGSLPPDARARVFERVSFAPGRCKDRLLYVTRVLLKGRALGLHGLDSACTALRALDAGAAQREDAEFVLETLRTKPAMVTWGLPKAVLQVLCVLGHAAVTELLALGQQVGRAASFGFRVAAVALLGRLEDGEAGRRVLGSLLDDLSCYHERAKPLGCCERTWGEPQIDFLQLFEEVIHLIPVIESADEAALRLARIIRSADDETGFLRMSLVSTCVGAAGFLDDSDAMFRLLEAEILVRPVVEIDVEVIRAAIGTLGRTHDLRALRHISVFAQEAAWRIREQRGGIAREAVLAVVEAWRAVRELGEDGDEELELVLEVLPLCHEGDRLEAMERLVLAGRETLDPAGRLRLLERLPLPLVDCCVRCATEEDTTRPFQWLLAAIEELIESCQRDVP